MTASPEQFSNFKRTGTFDLSMPATRPLVQDQHGTPERRELLPDVYSRSRSGSENDRDSSFRLAIND